MMTQIEITAEVFKIIRANDNMSSSRLWILIKEYLPEVSDEELLQAIRWIYERT